MTSGTTQNAVRRIDAEKADRIYQCCNTHPDGPGFIWQVLYRSAASVEDDPVAVIFTDIDDSLTVPDLSQVTPYMGEVWSIQQITGDFAICVGFFSEWIGKRDNAVFFDGRTIRNNAA